jgi:chemotaxis protein CheX
VKVEYINPFIDSTKKLMEIMVGIQQFEKKSVTVEHRLASMFDVSAIIGVTGDCDGSIVLSFSEGVAQEMLSRLLGEPVDDFNDDVCDAVGEMVNIITGNAAAQLQESGMSNLNRAIPKVLLGKGQAIKVSPNTPCINIEFSTELGGFALQVCLRFS